MLHNKDASSDRLIRIALVAAITYLSLQLLYPFLGVLAWGFILAVALYPAYVWLNARLGNRPVFTATLMTLINLIVIVGTIALLTNSMINTVSDLATRVHAGEQIVPLPPSALSKWPLVGEKLYQAWYSISSNLGELIKYSSYLIETGGLLLKKMAIKGIDLLLFIFSVVLSGYLMTQGKSFMGIMKKFANRIALERGSDLVSLMQETIQNVSRGVIGVSLLQTLLFGLILLAAGVPGAGLLSLIALILCIVQAGLVLLTIPIVIWLFVTKSFMPASIFALLLFITTLIDNFLKPYILSRGLRTPMMVIFLGVIGGVILYGLVGIFIGPVILAIFYDLVSNWLYSEQK
jgi:predicted PurR-regulated permease PerM